MFQECKRRISHHGAPVLTTVQQHRILIPLVFSSGSWTAPTMDDLAALIRTEIPEGRQNLKESFTNLERVAEYCEDNYYR